MILTQEIANALTRNCEQHALVFLNEKSPSPLPTGYRLFEQDEDLLHDLRLKVEGHQPSEPSLSVSLEELIRGTTPKRPLISFLRSLGLDSDTCILHELDPSRNAKRLLTSRCHRKCLREQHPRSFVG